MSEPLRLVRDGAVARLLIDRPDKQNAFTQTMWETLPELVDEAMDDPEVRLLILAASNGGTFSAGADIREFSAGASDSAWRGRNQAAIRRAQRELARAGKPTLALVEGNCIGGGCGLAIACDLRIATPSARFGITPSRLGLVYSLHDTKLLVDLVGPAQAKKILFTGVPIAAPEALRIGLVDLVADDAPAAAAALAEEIAAASPHSVAATKKMVRRILDGQAEDDEETLAEFDAAFDGEDFREGVDAFLGKRPPRFRDR